MKTNLTLSLEPSVIAKARRISKRRNTSISAMFSNFIILLEDESSFYNSILKGYLIMFFCCHPHKTPLFLASQ